MAFRPTLEIAQLFCGQRGKIAFFHFQLEIDDLLDLNEEPRINLGQLKYLLNRHPDTESIGDVPQAIRRWPGQLFVDRLRINRLQIETINTDFQTAQGFLQRLLEGAANRHDLADRLHLRRQRVIGLRKFFEGETWHFGDNVVDRRLERGGRLATGDVIRQLIQRVADRQLGGNLGDRKTGGLGGQRRRTRDARIHLDDDHPTVLRVDRELNVRTAGIDADFAQHGDRGVTQDLVFLVGQRLGRGNGDRVAGVDAHRIEVLDRADDDAVVRPVADHFHLVFLPAKQRFFNQQLVGRRGFETALADGLELFHVVGYTAARTTQRERRPDDGREANDGLHLVSLFHAVRRCRLGRTDTDLGHRILELLAVFSLVDGLLRSTDQFNIELGQHPFAVEVECAIERSLPTHRRQQRIRTLFLDDLGNNLPGNRLDVGDISHFRVGHDGRRI